MLPEPGHGTASQIRSSQVGVSAANPNIVYSEPIALRGLAVGDARESALLPRAARLPGIRPTGAADIG